MQVEGLYCRGVQLVLLVCTVVRAEGCTVVAHTVAPMQVEGLCYCGVRHCMQVEGLYCRVQLALSRMSRMAVWNVGVYILHASR